MIYRLLVSGIPYWLRVEDGISMSCSLETRVPYLDHLLVERALSEPIDKIFANGMNKSTLRIASSRLLPYHVKSQKQKLQRPGNSQRLVFKVLYTDALKVISECDELFSKYAVEQFKRDRALGKNGAFWFRAFLVSRWHTLNFPKSETLGLKN
jgi:Asparagine synthase (glutamine-hydrolyzing)